MAKNRTIVFGTTSDYIELLDSRFPGRLLFVTDFRELSKRNGRRPDEVSEYVCDLEKSETIFTGLIEHMKKHEITPAGITCFDCESLIEASRIAARLSLPFPSSDSVTACRSKYASKLIWSNNGVCCPRVRLIENLQQAVEFFEQLGRPLVLKPVSGSGSEFVFRCDNKIDLMRAYHDSIAGLKAHSNRRMYDISTDNGGGNSREVLVAEEFINGREYSCDIILDGDKFEIIRIAKKLLIPNQPLGTVGAYIIPAILPNQLDSKSFSQQLFTAAKVLGLERTMAMVDFVVHHDKAYLLEMTPRPGGDCLPPMIKASSGFDILGAAVDFAEGKQVRIPAADNWKKIGGVRIYATREGILKSIDTSMLEDDDRVLLVDMRKKAGDRVILPPEDYESRLLGNIIFVPGKGKRIEDECQEISEKVIVKTEASEWTSTKKK